MLFEKVCRSRKIFGFEDAINRITIKYAIDFNVTYRQDDNYT